MIWQRHTVSVQFLTGAQFNLIAAISNAVGRPYLFVIQNKYEWYKSRIATIRKPESRTQEIKFMHMRHASQKPVIVDALSMIDKWAPAAGTGVSTLKLTVACLLNWLYANSYYRPGRCCPQASDNFSNTIACSKFIIGVGIECCLDTAPLPSPWVCCCCSRCACRP